jgi:hypothetical protein
MPLTPDDILAFKVGDSTVGENLRRAIESGAICQHDDGSFALPARSSPSDSFVAIRNGPPLPCTFLNGFMFKQVYRTAAVPKGCEPCYKIKALPRTLRELVAMYEIALRIDCLSKWGIDFYNPHSQSLYAGYFYVNGLAAARALFPIVRQAADESPKLGAAVPIVIKRGCSNYEAALGPSDTYTFQPELSDIEAYLKSRYRKRKTDDNKLAPTLYGQWVPFAFQIGDNTYFDFTEGKPLYPKSATYDP